MGVVAGQVRFSSVEDLMHALGNAHMRSTLSQKFPLTLPLKQFQCSSN